MSHADKKPARAKRAAPRSPALRSGDMVGLGSESVEHLCLTWLKDAEAARKLEQNQHASDYDLGWNGAMSHALRMASEMVRAEMARANQRQPQHNTVVSHGPREDGASLNPKT